MSNRLVAISNHATIVGGGELSFIEMIHNIPNNWKPFVIIPHKGELSNRLRHFETWFIPLASLKPWNLANILLTLMRFLKLFRKHRPNLIYANGSRAILYGGIIGRLMRIPIIWHCRISHSDMPLDFLLGGLSNIIIANSNATARRFHPCFKQKIRVIYNGIDIEYYSSKNNFIQPEIIEDDWIIILVVARATRQKRHDIILSTFESIAELYKNAHLVCIGDKNKKEPHWWNHIQNTIQNSKYSVRIHWIGPVKDVRPWYKSATVKILASENESFGRVLVEAMACRLPVISTHSGGVPEIIRDGKDGLLVTQGNVCEMTNAVRKILEDSYLRESLVKSGIQRSHSFSLDAHMNKLVYLFEQAVKKKDNRTLSLWQNITFLSIPVNSIMNR